MKGKEPGRGAIGIWQLSRRALSPNRLFVDRSLIHLSLAKRKMELSRGGRRSAKRRLGPFFVTGEWPNRASRSLSKVSDGHFS